MDDTSQCPRPHPVAPVAGSTHSNLKKSFKVGVRSLLTACPREEFLKAFSGFTAAEQESLYGLFIQVITSLHENTEDELESFCLETQAGMTFDIVEQLVEEQSVDPLYSVKTNVGNIKQEFSAARKTEAQLLEDLIAKAEDQKLRTEARIELLKKKIENASNATGAVEKLRNDLVKYSANTSNGHSLLYLNMQC